MNDRLEWLDELRGIAALSVMFIHYDHLLRSLESRPFLIESLARGVQLFYVLSGYILYKLYSMQIGDWTAYRRFIVRRFFRVAPLFYFMTLIGLVVPYQEVPDPIINSVLHFLILPFGFFPKYIGSMIGIEWSIYVECWFYALFPLIVASYKRNPAAALGIASAISLAQSAAVFMAGSDVAMRTYYYLQPTTQLMFFMLGIALADRAQHGSAKRVSPVWFYLGILATLIAPYLVRSSTVQVYLSAISLALMVASYSSVPRPAWLRSLLLWVGTRSYSLYLIHLPLLMLTDFFFPSRGTGVVVWGAQVLLALSIAAMSWKLVEAPGIAFGRRLLSSSASR